MKRTLRWSLAAAVAVAVLAPAVPDPAYAAPAADSAALTASYTTTTCGGTKAMDTALATELNSKLNGKLRGALTGYRMSCARRIVETAKSRGLAKRAAAIAVTTAIVESTIENISVAVDHDSLGLFQQRASWGSAAQRLDPAYATNAFLNKMLQLYPNGSYNNTANSIGEICQAVQVSALPDAYQLQASDGSTIAYNIWDALTSPPTKPVDTVGMWNPADHSFHLLGTNAAGNSKWAFSYGALGDQPVTGDWDGNGKESVGIFRPGTELGSFHLSNNLPPAGASNYAFESGFATDVPLAGDWDGNGKDGTGFYRPSDGTFHLKDINEPGISNYAFQLGPIGTGVIPLAGDWDGDGEDSVGYYDPADSSFHLRNKLDNGSSDAAYVYGRPGDKPIMGDWDGNGTDTPGLYRPETTQFLLKNTHGGGNATSTFTGFTAGMVPVSGDWDNA
ncbi:hypothetical protein [Actinoplanes sp. NPDC026619]|uniref:hypothetical protein n=1 Tax=Actinoplanes sp. NPDC026619 TaxID=3155798 RepID=UPI0033C4A3BF